MSSSHNTQVRASSLNYSSAAAGKRESASALVCAVPFLCMTVNVNSERNKPHRAIFGDALGVFRYYNAE